MKRDDFQPTVYSLANRKTGALYTGATSNLMQRISQHRDETFDGHTKKVQAKMLVWYEQHEMMDAAICREKQIKKWNRQWRVNLIEESNTHLTDLAVEWGFPPLWTLDKAKP
jgi:putative endonuclease